MKQTKFKRFAKIIIVLFALLIFLGISLSCKEPTNNSTDNIELVDSTVDKSIQKIDSLQIELLDEITTYITKQAPTAHYQLPLYIMNAGITNNIDICFMMAQTQLETNFGTLGAGREISRRSLFGVYAKRYNNYEDAINDWCALLHQKYLGKGRTEQHLMKKYVTHSGNRYAENPKYEIELYSTYNSIKKMTNIIHLQNELRANLS